MCPTIGAAGRERRASCRACATRANSLPAMLRRGMPCRVRSAFAPSRNGRWPAAGRWLPCSHPVLHAMRAGHEPHERPTGGDDDHETDDSQTVRIGDGHVRCHGNGAIRSRPGPVAAVCGRHPAMPLGRPERFADRLRADRSVAFRFRRVARHVMPARPRAAQAERRRGATVHGQLSPGPPSNRCTSARLRGRSCFTRFDFHCARHGARLASAPPRARNGNAKTRKRDNSTQ